MMRRRGDKHSFSTSSIPSLTSSSVEKTNVLHNNNNLHQHSSNGHHNDQYQQRRRRRRYRSSSTIGSFFDTMCFQRQRVSLRHRKLIVQNALYVTYMVLACFCIYNFIPSSKISSMLLEVEKPKNHHHNHHHTQRKLDTTMSDNFGYDGDNDIVEEEDDKQFNDDEKSPFFIDRNYFFNYFKNHREFSGNTTGIKLPSDGTDDDMIVDLDVEDHYDDDETNGKRNIVGMLDERRQRRQRRIGEGEDHSETLKERLRQRREQRLRNREERLNKNGREEAEEEEADNNNSHKDDDKAVKRQKLADMIKFKKQDRMDLREQQREERIERRNRKDHESMKIGSGDVGGIHTHGKNRMMRRDRDRPNRGDPQRAIYRKLKHYKFKDRSNTTTSSNDKPTLLFHIGPMKTGSTTLQKSSLEDTMSLLQKDNWLYLLHWFYLANECMDTMPKDPNDPYNYCADRKKWKVMQMHLKKYSTRDVNLYFNDEMFGVLQDAKQYWDTITKAFLPWNVHIVVSYRRFFEWFPSFYYQAHIYGSSKDEEDIKGKYWPPSDKTLRYGNRIRPIHEYYDLLLNDTSSIYVKRWGTTIDKVHPTESQYVKFQKHFPNISIWNYNDAIIQSKRNVSFPFISKKGNIGTTTDNIASNFYCNVLNATHTCQLRKESGLPEDEQFAHASLSHNYDMLAVAAFDAGYIVDSVIVQRGCVAKKVQRRQEDELNLTYNDFPLVCMTQEQLNHIYNLSVTYEKRINQLSPQSSVPLIPWKSFTSERQIYEDHKKSFHAYIKKKKYCSIDAALALEQNVNNWKEFFLNITSCKFHTKRDEMREEIAELRESRQRRRGHKLKQYERDEDDRNDEDKIGKSLLHRRIQHNSAYDSNSDNTDNRRMPERHSERSGTDEQIKKVSVDSNNSNNRNNDSLRHVQRRNERHHYIKNRSNYRREGERQYHY